jgi:hypothetical protein
MLKSVQIRNFRSCRETHFECARGLCGLSGRNGVGKTNILKAIEWACSLAVTVDTVRTLAAGLGSPDQPTVAMRLAWADDDTTFDYNLEIPAYGTVPSKNGAGPPVFTESLTVSRDGVSTQIFQRRGETIDLKDTSIPIRVPGMTPALASLASLLPPGQEQAAPILRVRDLLQSVRYYAFDEQPPEPDFVSLSGYREWRLQYQSEGTLTDSVTYRLIYLQHEEPLLFDELIAILGPNGLHLVDTVSSVSTHEYKYVVSPPGHAVLPLNLSVRVTPSTGMGGSGQERILSQLSVGTRRVIQIVTSLIFDRRSVMLIEQPEDSIHPGLLRKLIDLLRTYSSESQILFTTHSAAVLNMLRPEEALLVSSPDGATQVRSLSAQEIGWAREFLESEGTLSEFLEVQEQV